MSSYLHPHLPGASVLFTVRLSYGTGPLLVDHIDLLRDAVRKTLKERPFTIDAWVVLPDHIHAVWTLPETDCDFSTRWSVIKARFSRQMPRDPRDAGNSVGRARGVWQRRFWEHHLCDTSAKAKAVAYCMDDPVNHGLVTAPEHWPYSSIHRDRRLMQSAA
ncbi:MAG: transposase [Pseudomonadota bacterium]